MSLYNVLMNKTSIIIIKYEVNDMTHKKANLLLVSVSMAWGTSYLLMKIGLSRVSPFNLIALRFGIAFLVTFIIFFKKIKSVSIKTIFHSALLGFILFCIFTALLLGLKTTTASSAGFLTGTTVAFVPIIQIFIKHKLPEIKIIICTCIVVIGISFLTLKNEVSVDFGAALCLLCAFFNGLYIVITNYFVQSENTLQLGIFQLGFATLFGSLFSFYFETPKLPNTTNAWIAVLGLALICSAYGFVMQPIAQKYTTPENAGFIFALEPMFSAIFAFLFLHEILHLQEYLGAILILISLFISSMGTEKMSNKTYVKTKNADNNYW